MGLMFLLAYAGLGIAFLFATLSLACGLYYLAELVEEYTVMTKKVITWITWTIAALHVILWISDRLPTFNVLFGLLSLGVYSLNLRTFPFIKLSSPAFILSCVFTLADHFMWFKYFTSHYYSFSEVASFFGLCVWLVPFAYFISLSANDNALPHFDPRVHNPDALPSVVKTGLVKQILNFVLRKKDEGLPSQQKDM
ncbi:uncharacterized protein VTP21DRAFT_4894 [Calcarisporiella thermophila]|uniref:uncharacterized protein n=1 Tax=Calcarisporiella thermophila TaxID=911321 RepID=UPI00374288F5